MDAIGKLAVILTGDARSFDRMIKGARKDLAAFAGDVGEVGRNVAGAGAAMVLPLVGSLKKFMDEGDRIAKHAQQIGVTAVEYQGLAHAADLAGAEIADVEKAVARSARSVYDAGRGSKEAADALKALGLSAADLAGKGPTEQFLQLSAALGAVEDDSRQMALAQTLLGKSAAGLIPFMEQETDAIREQMAEGARLVGLTNEQAAAAEVLNDEYARTSAAAKGVAMQIGAALAPAATDALRKAQALASEFAAWVRANPATIMAYAKVGTSLLAVGTGLLAIERAAKVARAGLAALSLTRKGILALVGSVRNLVTSTAALGAVGLVGVTATAFGVAALAALIRDHLREISALQNQIRKNMGVAVPGADASLKQLEFARKNLEMAQEQTSSEMKEQGWLSNLWGGGAVLETEYQARAEQLEELNRLIKEKETAEKEAAEAAAPGVRTDEQVQAVERMVKALADERDALSLSSSEYRARQMAAAGATSAEIDQAAAVQRSIDNMNRLKAGTEGVAEEAQRLARSYSEDLLTWGMEGREAELFGLEAKVEAARQKLLAAAMNEVTGAAYEQARAQVEAAEAALKNARATSELLDEQEKADEQARLNVGGRDNVRPAALERGTTEAYSASLRWRDPTKQLERDTARTAKASERTAKATERMADATALPAETVEVVSIG